MHGSFGVVNNRSVDVLLWNSCIEHCIRGILPFSAESSPGSQDRWRFFSSAEHSVLWSLTPKIHLTTITTTKTEMKVYHLYLAASQIIILAFYLAAVLATCWAAGLLAIASHGIFVEYWHPMTKWGLTYILSEKMGYPWIKNSMAILEKLVKFTIVNSATSDSEAITYAYNDNNCRNSKWGPASMPSNLKNKVKPVHYKPPEPLDEQMDRQSMVSNFGQKLEKRLMRTRLSKKIS